MATRKKPSKSKTSAKAKAGGGKRRRKAEVKPKDAAATYLFDNPRNVRRLIYAVYVVCGFSFLLDLVVHRHVDHPWESFFGFYAVFGLVGFVVLVLVATQLRKVLMRSERYYDN